MNPSHGPSSPAQARTQLWILWAALLLGPLLLLAVAFILVLGRDGEGLMGDQADPMIGTILGGLSILLVVKAWVVPLLIRSTISVDAEVEVVRQAGTEDRLAALALVTAKALLAFRHRALIGWAVAEGGAMLAAISILVGGLAPLALVAPALFVVTMALMAPTTSRILAAADRLLDGHAVSAHDLERTLDRP